MFTCRKSCFSTHSVKLLYFKIDTSLVSYPLQLLSVLSISHPCNCCFWLSPSSCTGCNLTQNPWKGNQCTHDWHRRFFPALVMQPDVLGLYLLRVTISHTVYESRRLFSKRPGSVEVKMRVSKLNLLFLLENGAGLLQLNQKARLVIHFGSQTIPILLPCLAKILQNNLQTPSCLINSPWCISLKIY